MPTFTCWQVLCALTAGPTWVTTTGGTTREAVGTTRTCVILRDGAVVPLEAVYSLETLEAVPCG